MSRIVIVILIYHCHKPTDLTLTMVLHRFIHFSEAVWNFNRPELRKCVKTNKTFIKINCKYSMSRTALRVAYSDSGTWIPINSIKRKGTWSLAMTLHYNGLTTKITDDSRRTRWRPSLIALACYVT
jgi:hypothetical protein